MAWKEGQIGQWRQSKCDNEFNSNDYAPPGRPWWVNDTANDEVNFIKNHNLPTDIDAFALDDKLFRKYSFPKTRTKFLQVIESGDLCCLYFWEIFFNY